MSDRLPRVSRRKLLQLTGLAPLAALASDGASSAALAQAAQECSGIPEEPEMRRLVDLALAYKSDLDETKYRLVVSVLWKYFCEGAQRVQGGVDQAHLLEVLEAAFNKVGRRTQRRCGELIIDNLAKWDVFQHEPRTNTCAFRAGFRAAKRAPVENARRKIRKSHFDGGFEDIEDEVGALMRRADQLRKDSVPEEDAPVNVGFGC